MLETSIEAVSLISSYSPTVEVDFVHIVDANLLAARNDTRIGTSNSLANVKVLQSENRHDIVNGPGSHDAFLRQADQDLVDLTSAVQKDNHKGPAIWTRAIGITPGHVLRLEGILRR